MARLVEACCKECDRQNRQIEEPGYATFQSARRIWPDWWRHAVKHATDKTDPCDPPGSQGSVIPFKFQMSLVVFSQFTLKNNVTH